jgi:hypothetical protein
MKTTPKSKKSINKKTETLCEGCGCSKEKMVDKIKKKYMKESPFDGAQHYTPTNVKTFSDTLDLTPYIGKTALVEMYSDAFVGIVRIFKGNFILENAGERKSLDTKKITKFVCENTRIVFSPKANDDTFLQEKKIHRGNKWIVTDESGKKVLGHHDSEKSADKQLAAIHARKAANMNEDLKLLIKDQIKSKFFFNEEIVNKDNKGKLTKDRQASRDNIASKLKNVKVVKGPPGRMDTPTEAKYRLATFIELNKNKQDK